MTIGPAATSDPTTTYPRHSAAVGPHGSESDRARWLARLGRVGVWSIELRTAPAAATARAAAELEAVGFRSLWIPGMGDNQAFDATQHLLEATRDASVVIGVQSIWRQEADEFAAGAAGAAGVERRYPGRLLAGLGISGAEIAHAAGKPFTTAVGEMGNCLTSLDHASTPLPRGARLWARSGRRWPSSPERAPQDCTRS